LRQGPGGADWLLRASWLLIPAKQATERCSMKKIATTLERRSQAGSREDLQ
jgi:hypothetical protein